MKQRKSWREKLERIQEARVVPVPARMQKRLGTGTLLIPRPLDVDAAIRKVKRGQVVTQREIRSHLAQKCGANEACPITTGIFVRIAAEAAAEEERSGTQRVTPWWRVVGDGGRLMEKLPGGVEEQAGRLVNEGHVVRAGRKMVVLDFQETLVRL